MKPNCEDWQFRLLTTFWNNLQFFPVRFLWWWNKYIEDCRFIWPTSGLSQQLILSFRKSVCRFKFRTVVWKLGFQASVLLGPPGCSGLKSGNLDLSRFLIRSSSFDRFRPSLIGLFNSPLESNLFLFNFYFSNLRLFGKQLFW